MNTSSIWPSRTSTTAALRREARKPTASASASTKPPRRSSIRWRSANASTPASSSCRLTSIPGLPDTTNSDHIRGAGATAKRQCKPSLTPSHSPGRNHWPHDVGQTQPFRHQTGQLSDQVSASTHEIQELDTPAALIMAGLDQASGNVEGGEQGRGSVPFVSVAEPGHGFAIGQLQPALGALQSLDVRLLVDRQHHRVLGRLQVEPANLGP